jgi:hypothetical protein
LQLSIVDVPRTQALDPPDELELLDELDELELLDELDELELLDELDELELLDELEPPPPEPNMCVSEPHAASATTAITSHGHVGPRFFHRI